MKKRGRGDNGGGGGTMDDWNIHTPLYEMETKRIENNIVETTQLVH